MKEFTIEEHKNNLVAVLEYDIDTLYLYICNNTKEDIEILEAVNVGLPSKNITESDFKLDWTDNKTIKVIYLGKTIKEYTTYISI